MWKCNFHTLPAKSHNWNSKYENSYFSCVAHWHRGDVHYNNNLRSDICCFICASLSLNICKLCFYINEQICLLPHLFVWWYKAATKSALHKGLTNWMKSGCYSFASYHNNNLSSVSIKTTLCLKNGTLFIFVITLLNLHQF